MRVTLLRAYLGVGLILIGVYVLAGGFEPIYESLGLAAAGAIVYGTLTHRPPARTGWLVLAASQAALGIGDLIYFSAYGDSPPYPSLADAFYLGGIVLFGVALIMIVGRSEYGRDLLSYVDAVVIAFALGLLVWAGFFSGAIGSGTDIARLVSVSYPLMEVGLLAALLRVFFVRGKRTWSYYALAASVCLLILSDTWYVVPALTDHYVAGSWHDVGWLGSYVLAGAAGLHPSMRIFVVPRAGMLHIRRVILLGLSVVGIAVAAMVEQVVVGEVDIFVMAGAGAVAGLFVVARVVGLIRVLERATAAALESERRFRMVFERAPIGISLGREGVMSETNPALQRMLGYTGDELATMHYTDVTHPDDRALTVQHELDEASRESFSAAKRYVRKDGSEVETHVNVALDIADGLGVSLIEDVSHKRELEDQLRHSQKMEAVGKLAGGVAHDFNNLMTAVIGYSDLLLGQVEDDRQLAKLGAIRDSAVRASELTRQLLAFGRRQVLQVDDVDLRDVVGKMESLLQRLVGEEIELQTVCGGEPVLVRADRAQLEQVMLNLVGNARDAMPTGGKLIVAVLSDGTDGILSVCDNGVGMDEALQARIFEPFFTTKPVGAGSGLGLASVDGIVGQSGGSLGVESAPGSGTTVVVRLPLARADAPPALADSAALLVEQRAATLVD